MNMYWYCSDVRFFFLTSATESVNMRIRIRGAGLLVSCLSRLRQYSALPIRESSRLNSSVTFRPTFQSGAVTLPRVCGNEGRCNSARFKGARSEGHSRGIACTNDNLASILETSRLYLSAECRAGTSPALSAHFSTGDRIQHRTHSCWLASNRSPLLNAGEKVGVCP